MLWWTLRQLKADDWRAREGAVRKLGEMRDARAIDSLVVALKDKNTHVRNAAENALVQIGQPSVRHLVAALKKHPEVRSLAKEALVKIGSSAVTPLGLALFEKDLAVRETAAAALGKIGDSSALEQLLTALKHGDFGAKEAAAAGLVRLGNIAVHPLVAALKEHKTRVRDTAAAALVRIGPAAIQPLIAVLSDGDVRNVALEALGKIDPQWARSQAARSALPTFVACLREGDERMRRASAFILGEIGDGQAVDPLVAALIDPNEAVQEAAIVALGRLGDLRALLPLAAALRKPDPRRREAAATAFVQIGKGLIDPLVDSLKDPDQTIRETAAAVLVRLGNSAVQPLAEALWQIDPEFGKRGADSLASRFVAAAKLAHSITAPPSKEESGGARHQRIIKAGAPKRAFAPAAETPPAPAMVAHDEPRDVDTLSMALDHPDAQVRAAAIKNLIQLSHAIDQPLLTALKTGNAPARRAAAHALAARGDLRAREALRTDLSDPEPVTVLDAAEGLVRLGDLNVVLGLLAVLRTVWAPSADSSRLYKAQRAFRLLHRLLELHAKDLPIDELHAISEFPAQEKPHFVASASSTPDEPLDQSNPYVLPGSDAAIDCATLRNLASRELLRRKMKGCAQ